MHRHGPAGAEGRALGALEERQTEGGRLPNVRGTRAASKILALNGEIAPAKSCVDRLNSPGQIGHDCRKRARQLLIPKRTWEVRRSVTCGSLVIPGRSLILGRRECGVCAYFGTPFGLLPSFLRQHWPNCCSITSSTRDASHVATKLSR